MNWTTADIPDEHGRTAVITGANVGVGLETAAALAAAGGRTVLACRDRSRAESAAEQLRARHAGVDVEVLDVDLGDLASVRRAASEAHDRFERIDVLINNAGVMVPPLSRTTDGFELQLGVNHLGHFALTGLVLDLIARLGRQPDRDRLEPRPRAAAPSTGTTSTGSGPTAAGPPTAARSSPTCCSPTSWPAAWSAPARPSPPSRSTPACASPSSAATRPATACHRFGSSTTPSHGR